MNARANEGEDVVTAALAGRFAATLGHPVRDFAPGEAAPHGLHWCLAPEYSANADLEADGIAASGIIPTLDLPRRLWAGATIRLVAPLRIGESVRRRSWIADTTRKVGRSGPLAFVRIGHRFTVDGETRIEEEQVIAYRAGALPPSSPLPAGEPPGGSLLRRVPTDPAMLFRFSALTFNAHRIHYDPVYARSEGLPERLVHGTLTAALLLDACTACLGNGATVSLQALAPISCGAALDLVRLPAGGAARAAARVDDVTAMTLAVVPSALS